MSVLMMSMVLLAEGLGKDERFLLWMGALVGSILVAAFIVAKADRWRKRQMAQEDDTSLHSGSFRQMYENGELSKEEYDNILRKIKERKQTVAPKGPTKVTAPANDTAPQAPPSSDPPPRA